MFHPVELTPFWGLVKAKSAAVPAGPLSSCEGDTSFHSRPARASNPCVQSQPLRIRTQMERFCNTSITLPQEIVWANGTDASSTPGAWAMPVWMKVKGHLVRIFDSTFNAPGG